MGNCCGSSSTKDDNSDHDAYGSTRHVRQGYIENSRRQHQTALSALTHDTPEDWSHTNTYITSNRGYIPPYHTNPQAYYRGEDYGRTAGNGVTAATPTPSYRQSTAVHDQQYREQTVKTTDPKQQLYVSQQQQSHNSELVAKGASSNKKIQNPYKKLISDAVRKSSSSSKQRLHVHVRGADKSASPGKDAITHPIKVEYNNIHLVIKASKLLEYLIEGYLKTNNSTQSSLGIVCSNHIQIQHYYFCIIMVLYLHLYRHTCC